jgi:hypothetical protein
MKPTVLHKSCVSSTKMGQWHIAYTYISGQHHTLNLIISCFCKTGEQKYMKLKCTKYWQYFWATPYIPLDLSVFAKLLKATIGFDKSVCTHGTRLPFMKFAACIFFKNRSGKLNFQ